MECPSTGVITTLDFPQCCWTCARYINCDAPAQRTGEIINDNLPSKNEGADGVKNDGVDGGKIDGGSEVGSNIRGWPGDEEDPNIPKEPMRFYNSPKEPNSFHTENPIMMDSMQLDAEGHPIIKDPKSKTALKSNLMPNVPKSGKIYKYME